MFDQKQIAELKEAFTFIDQNADGLIDRDDLVDIWTSLGTCVCCSNFHGFMDCCYVHQCLGQEPTDQLLDEMLAETGPLNFTLFLTLMGERLQGGDSESDLLEAFEQFEPSNSAPTGSLPLETLRDILLTGPDKMEEEQVAFLLRDIHIDKLDNVNYRELIKQMKQTC